MEMDTNHAEIKSNSQFSLKKNDVDDLFLNLSENPIGQENKDFRLQLSTIYQLFEDEFSDLFATPNLPFRNTDFYFILDGEKIKVFVTPTNNFDFYAKAKGSLFRFSSEYIKINGKQTCGYIIPIDMIWDYFTQLDGIVDFDAGSESFNYINRLTQTILKLIEKLYFIPAIEEKPQTFKVVWELFIKNRDAIRLLNTVKNDAKDEYFIDENQTANKIEKIIANYVNYIIYKFLGLKSVHFKDAKSAIYFIKDIEHKRYLRSVDLAETIAQWLDELYIGKYDILPFIEIKKVGDDDFELKIKIKNKTTQEIAMLDDLMEQRPVFGMDLDTVSQIVEKQLRYAHRYMPEIEDIFEEGNDYALHLHLNEVYKIMTQTIYYLNKANIEVILPEGLDNIVVPRASINAKIKENRSADLYELLNSNNADTIMLDEILSFSYSIAIGDEKLTPEEFEKLSKNAEGLIKFKNQYVLIDKNEREKLLKKVKNPDIKNLTKLDLLHASLSGSLDEFEFDYDAAFAEILKDMTKTEDISVSPNLEGTLRPYQEKGFKWLYTNTQKGFGCCMADDMGLGKTIQVISLIVKLKDEKKLKHPVLVVCPTTLVGNWVKELKMFASKLKVSVYHGIERELDTKADIIITTYAILRIDIEKLKKQVWGALVVDEAQNIKNPDTSQTQAVKSLKSNIKIAMTGTPVENRLNELWSIFDFINKGYLGSLRDFQKSYAIPIERFKELKRAEKLRLSVSPFVLRRLKTDKSVIADLPEKVVMDEYCYLAKQQAVLYEKVLEDIMGQISQVSGINRRGLIFKLITALKQVCNHPYQYLRSGDLTKEMSGKTEKFMSLLQSINDNNEKTLVFTQYKEMGHLLTNIIQDEMGYEPLFFHGSLTRAQRDEVLDKFQNDDNVKTMILSLKAGGTGLNLTSATNVIHYDLWWNPAVEDQATDRTYRIGQDKNVMVHRLITLSTFEEKIDEMIKAKKELADLAVFEGEKIITELSDQEIYDIFSLSG